MNSRRAAIFVLALVLTFVITRGYLYFAPNTDFDIGPYNIHHLFTGLLLITLFGIPLILFHGNHRLLDVSTIGFGAGMSLSLDEWVYLIATDGSNTSYWLPVSFWGGGDRGCSGYCVYSGIICIKEWQRLKEGDNTWNPYAAMPYFAYLTWENPITFYTDVPGFDLDQIW